MDQAVTFSYTNHKGEHAVRTVTPIRLYYGTSQWHHKSQWLLQAHDHDKQASRTFSMNDVSNWAGKE